jgi:hypothetical protein
MCGHRVGRGCEPRAGRPSAPGSRRCRRGRTRCRRARARRPCPHATARRAACASGRARRPTARVPPAPDAGTLPMGQPGSASESASTAILRHPHQQQIMGLLSGRAWGLRLRAALPSLAAASSREACSCPAPTRPGPSTHSRSHRRGPQAVGEGAPGNPGGGRPPMAPSRPDLASVCRLLPAHERAAHLRPHTPNRRR